MKSLAFPNFSLVYSKIPLAVKLFFPVSSLFLIFLGVWTGVTYLFFQDFLEKSLREETEAFTSILLNNLGKDSGT